MGIDSRFMSKGNIEGGLTTIEEKSLGAVRKGGTRPIQGVLENSWRRLERPSRGGLWLQDGTGSDIPSMTHMVAAGAQIIAFTTGVLRRILLPSDFIWILLCSLPLILTALRLRRDEKRVWALPTTDVELEAEKDHVVSSWRFRMLPDF